MYKTYHKNDYDVMYYRFDSISEFVDYLSTAPVQYGSFDRLASETGVIVLHKLDHLKRQWI